MYRITATAALALALCAPTHAIEQGGYVGVSVISTDVDISADDFDDGSFIASRDDNTATGFKFRGGYNFNPHVGLEASWVDGGTISIDAVSDGSAFFYPAGPLAVDMELGGITVGLNGYLPFSDNVHGVGRIGFFRWSTDIDVTVASTSASDSADDTDMFFGLGIGVDAGPLTIELGWSRYDLGDIDADAIDLGLLFTPGK